MGFIVHFFEIGLHVDASIIPYLESKIMTRYIPPGSQLTPEPVSKVKAPVAIFSRKYVLCDNGQIIPDTVTLKVVTFVCVASSEYLDTKPSGDVMSSRY